MSQLLISVRNASEANMIPLDRVGILDIKEPNRGGLGKADNQTISEIQTQFAREVSVSAALGELVDVDPDDLKNLPPLAFAKFGLSQLAKVKDWKSRWQKLIGQLPKCTVPVGVIYADWQSCSAPAPESILRAATELQCGALLIDTYDKTAGNVFSQMKFAELDSLCVAAQHANLKFVLAGGIRNSDDLKLALQIAPDLIGVRGAVCNQERTGKINRESLNNFLNKFGELVEKSSFATDR